MSRPIVLFLILYLSSEVYGQLSVDFYAKTCPSAESIIKKEVQKGFAKNKGNAAGLIRLQFHDCFVRGCDASVMIKSTKGNSAEEDGLPNVGLRGFEVIENAKAKIENKCKGIVSCADILAYAARDAVLITGGLGWNVSAGRRDGRISRAEDTSDLPGPSQSLAELTAVFAKKNISLDDMVALSGAHTLGRAHCMFFNDRLHKCGVNQSTDPKQVVDLNQTPALFENSYYLDILNNTAVFDSDEQLTTSTDALANVNEYAGSNLQWLKDFRDGMINLSQVEVLTGSQGEIRTNCRVINPPYVAEEVNGEQWADQ